MWQLQIEGIDIIYNLHKVWKIVHKVSTMVLDSTGEKPLSKMRNFKLKNVFPVIYETGTSSQDHYDIKYHSFHY